MSSTFCKIILKKMNGITILTYGNVKITHKKDEYNN